MQKSVNQKIALHFLLADDIGLTTCCANVLLLAVAGDGELMEGFTADVDGSRRNSGVVSSSLSLAAVSTFSCSTTTFRLQIGQNFLHFWSHGSMQAT